jgi:hydrogenase/urease accessory protein HupE
MRKILFFRTSAIVVLLITGEMLFLPRDASAHLVTTGAGPFYDGIAHFFLSFDEILPIIGLALFTGLRGPKYGRWNAAIISFAWFIGGIAGLSFPMQQPPSLLSSLLMLLPGILLASDWKLSVRIALAFSALVGLVLGFLNGALVAGSGSNSGPLTMIGASASVLILSIFGSALAVVLSTGWTRIALRVAGSWLAALGLLALGWALKK